MERRSEEMMRIREEGWEKRWALILQHREKENNRENMRQMLNRLKDVLMDHQRDLSL